MEANRIWHEPVVEIYSNLITPGVCGIVHGDICHWNVILTEPKASRTARLLLIDMGDLAPDYEVDADALGNLLLWCLEHSAELKDAATRKRIVIAAALAKDGYLDRAIGVLSLTSKTKGSSFKRPPLSGSQEVKRRRL